MKNLSLFLMFNSLLALVACGQSKSNGDQTTYSYEIEKTEYRNDFPWKMVNVTPMLVIVFITAAFKVTIQD